VTSTVAVTCALAASALAATTPSAQTKNAGTGPKERAVHVFTIPVFSGRGRKTVERGRVATEDPAPSLEGVGQ
jgi:hypothetical protein